MELKLAAGINIEFIERWHSYKLNNVWAPGVTKVISILKNPYTGRALWNWIKSNPLEFIKTETDRATTVGDCVHAAVENYVSGKEVKIEYPIEFAELVNNSWESFLGWWNGKQIKPIAAELQVASLKYHYVGTLDLLAEENGKPVIKDWKTSKVWKENKDGVLLTDESGNYIKYPCWDEYKIQVVAYKRALAESYGIEITEPIEIIRFDKKLGTVVVDFVDPKQEDDLFAMFLDCLSVLKRHKKWEAEKKEAEKRKGGSNEW